MLRVSDRLLQDNDFAKLNLQPGDYVINLGSVTQARAAVVPQMMDTLASGL